MASISINFIDDLPQTQRDDDSTWVLIDQLTKLAQTIQTETMLTTHELAYQLVDELS